MANNRPTDEIAQLQSHNLAWEAGAKCDVAILLATIHELGYEKVLASHQAKKDKKEDYAWTFGQRQTRKRQNDALPLHALLKASRCRGFHFHTVRHVNHSTRFRSQALLRLQLNLQGSRTQRTLVSGERKDLEMLRIFLSNGGLHARLGTHDLQSTSPCQSRWGQSLPAQ